MKIIKLLTRNDIFPSFNPIVKPGDILSCISSGFLAKGIQFFTKSRFNHTALVIELWGELYVIDSQRDGTNPRALNDWLSKYKYDFVIHRNPLYNEQGFKYIMQKALSRSGSTPYDFKSLLWYQPIYQVTGKWKGKRGIGAEERMYCSEYVAWVYDIPNWWKLSPAALYDYLDESDEWDEVKID